MNPALITAICTGVVSVIGALTALLHSIGTRRQLQAQAPPSSPPSSPGSPTTTAPRA